MHRKRDGWTIRRAVPADRDALLELLGRVYGDSAPSPRWWSWAFDENRAAAESHTLVAAVGGRFVGLWSGLPVRLQHRGRPILGLRGVYVGTDPDYRRRGILTALCRRADDEYGAEAPLLIGAPNPITQSVLARQGGVELRPYPRLLRPMVGLGRQAAGWRRPAYPAGAVVELGFKALDTARRIQIKLTNAGDRRIEDFETFGPWADQLWEALAPGLGTCAVRDAAYLNWRFKEAPFEYRRLAIFDEGGPAGFAAMSSVQREGGRVVFVLNELMVRPGDKRGARLLIDRVISAARAERATGIMTLATRRHPLRRELMRAGFLSIRWPRSELVFSVRISGAGRGLIDEAGLAKVDDWYLSGADLSHR